MCAAPVRAAWDDVQSTVRRGEEEPGIAKEIVPHHGAPPIDNGPSRERSRLRYGHAVLRLREAGIPVRADPEGGAREHAKLRAGGERDIQWLAPALGFSVEEVDWAACGERSRGTRP